MKTKYLLSVLIATSFSLMAKGQVIEVKVDGIEYTLNTSTGTAKVTSNQDRTVVGDVSIPEVVAYNNNSYQVTGVDHNAFYYCEQLTSICLPTSLVSIGDQAFRGCSNLKSVVLPHGVTEIGSYAFANCNSLTTVTIPGSVTSLGSAMFSWCTGLRRAFLVEGLETVSDYLFAECTSLESVFLPSSVQSIKMCAFGRCPMLHDVYCLASTPPELHQSAFYESPTELMILHVRNDSFIQYLLEMASNRWPRITVVDLTEEELSVRSVDTGAQTGVSRYYTMDGKQVAGIRRGLNIIRSS